MWKEIEKKLLALAEQKVEELVNNFELLINGMPTHFYSDAGKMSVTECKDWIESNGEATYSKGMFPIYGYWDCGQYDGAAAFLLIDIFGGKFYEIHGSHCSCYGFEGQFTLEETPMEYICNGKKWGEANETVMKVIGYLADNEEELKKYAPN